MRPRFSSVVGLLLLLVAGCATLPARRSLAPDEEDRARVSFRQLAEGQKICEPWADAEALLTLNSAWQSGSLSGYLQLLAPGYLRFVGLNPLGQPQLIVGTDGREFKTVLPAEARVYEGPVTAAAFQRYVPPGLNPEAGFYWLIGRLQPGVARIVEVSGAVDSADLWVKISYGAGGGPELVRLDPERLLIRRHLLLDEQGEVVMAVDYDDHAAAPCALPGLVTIRGARRDGTLELRFRDWQVAVPLSAADFAINIPPGYNRIKIP